MRKTILFGIIFLLFLSVVSATEVSVSVSSSEAINGYFDLNSPDNDVYINGVNYQGYVDNEVYQATKGSMTKSGIADTLEKSWLTFIGERRPYDYDSRIANIYFNLITHTLNYVYDNWILPMQIKQNAIISTLDQDSYCKNLASEYFKVYKDESFTCEQNNMTYFRDMKFSIQVNHPPEFCSNCVE